jgi:peptidoglycan/LPS O-acetylase OafA/YrhL
MPTAKIYFPALDSLRAIAMLLVFAAHLGPVAATVGVGNIWTAPAALGAVGLVLFFVLSGFLITYLLLVEQKDRKRIDIPRFYLRRILRIWPLYFIIVGIGQFLIPCTGFLGLDSIYSATAPNFRQASLYYLFFLPNLAFLTVSPVNPLLGYTWSIGVEEQFYLVWPLVLQLGRRHLQSILGLIILLVLWSTWIYIPKLSAAIHWSNMGFFALGGLMAFFRAKRPHIIIALSTRTTQVVVLLLSAGLIAVGQNFAGGWAAAILFSLVILHATQPSTLIGRLRYPWLRYLGRISYGMYIFHVLVITLIVRAWAHAGMPVTGWGLPLLTFVATVTVGTLSWYGIERFFLQWRRRFGSIAQAASRPKPIS